MLCFDLISKTTRLCLKPENISAKNRNFNESFKMFYTSSKVEINEHVTTY